MLNPMPAVFELTIDNWGITNGTIWRWVQPDTGDESGEPSQGSD